MAGESRQSSLFYISDEEQKRFEDELEFDFAYEWRRNWQIPCQCSLG